MIVLNPIKKPLESPVILWPNFLPNPANLHKRDIVKCIGQLNEQKLKMTTIKSSLSSYLVLILLVSHIGSNAFTTNKRKFKGVPRTIIHMALFKYLREKKNTLSGHIWYEKAQLWHNGSLLCLSLMVNQCEIKAMTLQMGP